MDIIKQFIKELKRVRWTKPREATRTFLKVVLFIIVIGLLLFGFGLAMNSLWTELGVGLNGN